MDVTIDGERNFAFQGTPQDLMDVLVAVNDFLRVRGRAMLSMEINGKNVNPGPELEALKSRPVHTMERLEVRSEELAVLVDETLRQIQETAPELSGLCHELAQVFHSEHPEDGYEPFHQLADIWSVIKSREVLVVNMLGLSLEDLRVGDLSFTQMHQELNGFLEEAAQALKNSDSVLLGDLLEYELAPRAEKEPEFLALLQQRIPAKQG